MIFWTLDAMALRVEAYLTSAWQQHSRSGSGRGRGAWKGLAARLRANSGVGLALYRRRMGWKRSGTPALHGSDAAGCCIVMNSYSRTKGIVARTASPRAAAAAAAAAACTAPPTARHAAQGRGASAGGKARQ